MSKLRKAILIELSGKLDTKQQVERAVAAFNTTIAKSIDELNTEINDYQKLLLKLEK